MDAGKSEMVGFLWGISFFYTTDKNKNYAG